MELINYLKVESVQIFTSIVIQDPKYDNPVKIVQIEMWQSILI